MNIGLSMRSPQGRLDLNRYLKRWFGKENTKSFYNWHQSNYKAIENEPKRSNPN